ncbi:MAG: hypothetical protein ACJA1L_000044 [Paracoccaceae bacterium]|jgi:hypothetical protein
MFKTMLAAGLIAAALSGAALGAAMPQPCADLRAALCGVTALAPAAAPRPDMAPVAVALAAVTGAYTLSHGAVVSDRAYGEVHFTGVENVTAAITSDVPVPPALPLGAAGFMALGLMALRREWTAARRKRR